MDEQTYQTPNGPKTLAQIKAELLPAPPAGAGYNGPMDDASIIAAYNATASAGSSQTGGSGNAAQDLLDAIASGDQQRFDEAKQQYQQTSSTNLATSLLGTAAQLRGPEDYFKFNEYTSGGRNLWQQLFGNQPRPDFSAPTGPITPETITTLLQQLGMLPPATTQPTINPAAPAGSVPAVGTQNVNGGVSPAAPPAPTTPLSGVAASVGASPAVSPQAVQQPAPVSTALPIPASAQPAAAQTTQGASWPTAPATTTAPAATPQTASQTTMPGLASGWKNLQQPVPLPYQINPAVWDSMGSVGQALTLAAAEAAGWDKNEYERQINAARPQGTAPPTSSTTFAGPRGAFS